MTASVTLPSRRALATILPPDLDAKRWALTGAPGDGRVPNVYCWDRGRDYFTAAFTGRLEGKMLAPVDRERLYAQSWRALGETAHLLADMTCIPHVRNDSHPGVSIQKMVLNNLLGPVKTIAASQFDPNMGILRNDP